MGDSAPPELAGDSGAVISAFPVPEGLVVRRASPYWCLFAQEPTFLALASIPDRGLTSKEVLVYDRVRRLWSSILVPGDESTVRPLNAWIIGDVVHSNPQNNWERRTGGPGTISDSSILIDPGSQTLWVLNLGHDSEILWVEQRAIYYRSGSSLYVGRIQGADLVDRKLLTTDARLKWVHWAFRGGN